MFCEAESDSEVFEGNGAELAFARTSSSSSSRKSSYEDPMDDKHSLPSDQQELAPTADHMTPSPSPSNPPTVVEWKPHGIEMEAEPSIGSPKTSQGGAGSEGLETPQGDLKAIYGSTVTVTIDPPRDNGGGVDAEVSDYLDGGGGRKEEEVVARTRNLMDLFDNQDDDEDIDLFGSQNKVDIAEEDDSEPPPPTKICLMSK